MDSLDALFDELSKIAEATKRKRPLDEKVVEVGAPMLVGSGVGKTLSDLSFDRQFGASPRRKTLGILAGALSGLGYHLHGKKTKERKRAFKASTKTKTADPFTFKGFATKSTFKKPGPSISKISPKIGRIGTLPK